MPQHQPGEEGVVQSQKAKSQTAPWGQRQTRFVMSVLLCPRSTRERRPWGVLPTRLRHTAAQPGRSRVYMSRVRNAPPRPVMMLFCFSSCSGACRRGPSQDHIDPGQTRPRPRPRTDRTGQDRAGQGKTHASGKGGRVAGRAKSARCWQKNTKIPVRNTQKTPASGYQMQMQMQQAVMLGCLVPAAGTTRYMHHVWSKLRAAVGIACGGI